MGFAPTWLRQVSPPPLLHKTTLTTPWLKTKIKLNFNKRLPKEEFTDLLVS